MSQWPSLVVVAKCKGVANSSIRRNASKTFCLSRECFERVYSAVKGVLLISRVFSDAVALMGAMAESASLLVMHVDTIVDP